MIAYFLQTLLCMAVFYSFYHLVLRRETLFQSNRLYLLITLLLSFLLPLINVYVESKETSSVVLQAPLYVGTYVQTIGEIVVTPKSAAVNWISVGLWTYSAVTAMLLLRMIISIARIWQIRRRGSIQQFAGYACIVSTEIKCPFSFFNEVYMPAEHTFSQDELIEVVRHERAHVSGNHTLDVLIAELACIVFWLNPFTYLYRKSLKDLHEFMADAAVIETTPWDEYAQLLIANKNNSFETRLSNHLIFSQLKKRLLMMNKERTGMAGRLKYFGVLPVLLIALVLFSFRPQESQQPDFPIGETKINQSPDPVLYISADKRYFMNGSEVHFDQLGDVFKSVTQHKRDWTIAVVMHDDLKAGDDFSRVTDIGTPLHIGLALHVGPEYNAYKADMEKMIRQLDAQKFDPLGEEDALTTILAPLSPLDAKLDPLDMDSPIFPGCSDLSMDKQQQCSTEKLYAYMAKHLVYPEVLKRDKIEGKVMVKFIVGADGFVKDASILRTLHPDADASVLKLIHDMNSIAGKWQPVIKEGKAIDAEMILPVSFVLDEKPKDKPFAYVEEMPRPDGCEHITDATERTKCSHGLMYKFLAENILYPKEDKEKQLEGTCIVQFVVGANGSLNDIKVLRFPSESMKLEATRVFQLMAANLKWIPGRHEGNAVDVSFTVPIKFVLDQEDASDVKPAENNNGLAVVTQSDAQTVQVIPNPATNTITVKLFEGVHTIAIVDANAKQVASQRVDQRETETSISVANLSPGKYYVQLIANNESRSGSFIKQ